MYVPALVYVGFVPENVPLDVAQYVMLVPAGLLTLTVIPCAAPSYVPL